MRTIFRSSWILSVLLCSWPALVDAQLCTGRPGAGAGSIQADAEFESFDGGRAVSVGARAVGQQLFLGVAVGSVRYAELGGSTLSLGGSVGYEYPLGEVGRVAVCPMVIGAMGFGPLNVNGSAFDAGSRGASFGLGIGYLATSSQSLSLIPTAALAVARSYSTLSDGITTFESAETYGSVVLGLGAVFGRRFAAQPWILVPVGLEDAKPSFGLTVSYTVGRRY